MDENKLLAHTMTTVIALRLMGVKDIEMAEEDLFSKSKIKFTVPERTEIDKDEVKKLGGLDVESCSCGADDLKKQVKSALVKELAHQIDDDDISEDDVKEMFTFLCKVRTGEVWTAKECVDEYNDIKKQMNTIRERTSGYSEV